MLAYLMRTTSLPGGGAVGGAPRRSSYSGRMPNDCIKIRGLQNG
ncbi:hypothetical protein [Sphingobacterium sp.]